MRPRTRLLIRVVVGLAVALVLVAGVLAVLVVRGRDAERASIADAVERYQSATTVAAETTDRPNTTVTAVSDVVRPAPGVYTLTGSGTEKLSFQTSGQTMGPTMPATVTWSGDSCWDLRVDYNANHWQTWAYCIEGGTVVDRGGTVFQRFDLVVAQPETTSVTICEPGVTGLWPGIAPGTTWNDGCVITGNDTEPSEQTGTVTFVGEDSVTVEGTDVPVSHVRYEQRFDGSQQGAATLDKWYALDTGLPVRSVWDLEITSNSPIGDVTYRESGSWEFASLLPVG